MEKEEFVGIKMRKGLILSKKGGQLTPVPSWKLEEEEAGPSNSYAINRKNTTSARKLGACLWEVQNQPPLCNTNLMGKTKAITSEPNSPISTPSLDPTVTQRSSLHLKGRNSGYNTKTSAELVRVLNRIWRLEEELASNVSLVNNLKADLHHAHSHIQELMQKQQSYRFEIKDLMTRVSQDKLSRTDKGHDDKLMITIQSLNHEIEDEKKARFFLEDLCDEFAKGFLEYEQENRKGTCDQSLHHLSKLWLDERVKLRVVEANGNKPQRKKVVEKINSEISSYLQKKMCSGSKNDRKEGDIRHQSFESVHFNGNVSAPKEEDDDSIKSDFHSLELKADSEINQHSLEGSKGKHRDTLVNETEKMHCYGECSMTQDTNIGDRNKNLLDISRGNSSDKGSSLKKKLIEARLEGQHARLRASKGSAVA